MSIKRCRTTLEELSSTIRMVNNINRRWFLMEMLCGKTEVVGKRTSQTHMHARKTWHTDLKLQPQKGRGHNGYISDFILYV